MKRKKHPFMEQKLEQLQPDRIAPQITERIQELEDLLASKKEALERSPDGSIWLFRSHGRAQFYQKKHGQSPLYLGDKKRTLISRLAQKRYDTQLCRELHDQIRALKKMQRLYRPDKLDFGYESLPAELRAKVNPVRLPDHEAAEKWESQESKHDRLGFSDAMPIFETSFGLRVRSKSELLIAEQLRRHGVPFIYEHPFRLAEGMIVYPDFYCLNLETRRPLIWEHFGMMDDKEYLDRALLKIRNYVVEGCEDGVFWTMETKRQPLSVDQIEGEIEARLLH